MQHGFVRDEKSGAMLNTDNSSLAAYKRARAQAAELNTTKLELAEVKNLLITNRNELAEIKELLKALNR